MSLETERAARIIESQVVGDGSEGDAGLCAVAKRVRAMPNSRDDICTRIFRAGREYGIADEVTKAITDAVFDGIEAD